MNFMAIKNSENKFVFDKAISMDSQELQKLKTELENCLIEFRGVSKQEASSQDWVMALIYFVRRRVMQLEFPLHYDKGSSHKKKAVFLSMEYLPGPQLDVVVDALGLRKTLNDLCKELDIDYQLVKTFEFNSVFGSESSEKGDIASNWIESLSSQKDIVVAYGLRYRYGDFQQKIIDGWQLEYDESWLEFGNPWEISRDSLTFEVKFCGHTGYVFDENKHVRIEWYPAEVINGMASDYPVLGHRNNTVNRMRLWTSMSSMPMNMKSVKQKGYFRDIDRNVFLTSLTRQLFPDSEDYREKTLQLAQHYFFVSCSIQDVFRNFLSQQKEFVIWSDFHRHYHFYINDVQPSLAIVEMLRLLLDEQKLAWDCAWKVITQSFTFLAHESKIEPGIQWPINILEKLLPRHLELIYEINHRFLESIRSQFPGDARLIKNLSMVDEVGQRSVRLYHLAWIGSQQVLMSETDNHAEKKGIIRDFLTMMPGKLEVHTMGVSPRRYLSSTNQSVSQLITSTLNSDAWKTDLSLLKQLEQYSTNFQFMDEWDRCKWENKSILSQWTEKNTSFKLNPNSLLSVNTQGVNQKNRLLLSVLYIILVYFRLKDGLIACNMPRSFLFAVKAKPDDAMTKLIIKLIHHVAEFINKDPDVDEKLKILFLPDYSVDIARLIYPATDLAEHLMLNQSRSSQPLEGVYTQNIKFALNGALTLGGVNESNMLLREVVGTENFYVFGSDIEDSEHSDWYENYRPLERYEENSELKRILDSLLKGVFSFGDTSLFKPIVDELKYNDEYGVCLDFNNYSQVQDKIDLDFVESSIWTQRSILNVARMGVFSSDFFVDRFK